MPGIRELFIWSAMSTYHESKMAMTQLIAETMDLNLLRTGYFNGATLFTIAVVLGKDEIVQELLQESCYPDIWSNKLLPYDLKIQ